MKLTETKISETLELNTPLLYDNRSIIDNGYGKYTHKLLFCYYTETRVHTTFRILFNPETISRGLYDAFMQAGIELIDLYDNTRIINKYRTHQFELVKSVYYDFDNSNYGIREFNERYNGIKKYINAISKNTDIYTIISVKINKGEYTASKGFYSTNVQGGCFKL